MLAGTVRRLQQVLEARAAEEEEDALRRDVPLLAPLTEASLRMRSIHGPQPGARWRRAGDRVEPAEPDDDPDASPRVPAHRGLILHADVAVPAGDRRRLERLCRYAAPRRWARSVSKRDPTDASGCA
jgi:hypothetical protein